MRPLVARGPCRWWEHELGVNRVDLATGTHFQAGERQLADGGSETLRLGSDAERLSKNGDGVDRESCARRLWRAVEGSDDTFAGKPWEPLPTSSPVSCVSFRRGRFVSIGREKPAAGSSGHIITVPGHAVLSQRHKTVSANPACHTPFMPGESNLYDPTGIKPRQ